MDADEASSSYSHLYYLLNYDFLIAELESIAPNAHSLHGYTSAASFGTEQLGNNPYSDNWEDSNSQYKIKFENIEGGNIEASGAEINYQPPGLAYLMQGQGFSAATMSMHEGGYQKYSFFFRHVGLKMNPKNEKYPYFISQIDIYLFMK